MIHISNPTRRRTNLSAMEYWDSLGTEKTKEVCEKAGLGYEGFKHIAHLRRRPSIALAKRLVAASGNVMGFAALLDVVLKK